MYLLLKMKCIEDLLHILDSPENVETGFLNLPVDPRGFFRDYSHAQPSKEHHPNISQQHDCV